MTIPLLVLAVLSVVGGFIGLPAWLGPNTFARFLEPSLAQAGGHAHAELSHEMEMGFAAISVLVALTGILVAYRLYVARPALAVVLASKWRGIHNLLFRKYYLDEIYDALVVRPIVAGSRHVLWKGIDTRLIDGLVNGAGLSVQAWAAYLKNIQNGLARSYATWILFGAVALLFYITVMRG
jgi:NADH-quinone oxidoreductase subunit L